MNPSKTTLLGHFCHGIGSTPGGAESMRIGGGLKPPRCATISPAPSPCPAEYLKGLLSEHKLHRTGVAAIVKVDIRTVHRWCSGERAIPWAAAELLRRVLEEGRP